MRERDNNFYMDYEDNGFGSTPIQQNEALANIINPPAPSPAPAPQTQETSASDATIEALKKQILGQGKTEKWTGQGLGSAEANAADMAKILAGIGITDISQFGPITKQVQEIIGTDDGGNPIYDTQTQNTFGNKVTGQAVPLTYSGRQTGNFFGGTYEGKGNTGYGVQFAPDGTPIFYTQGASSNTLSNLMQDMGPMFQIGMALATGGLSIPQQIAANMAIGVLSGQDIGDVIKSAAISAAMPNVAGSELMKDGVKFIEQLGLDKSITSTLTKSFQNAAMSGTRALLTGTDISDAVLKGAASGGINGAITEITNNIDGFKDLSKAHQRMVVNAVTGVVSGRPLDQIVINSAIAAANAEAAAAKAQTQKQVLDPYFTPTSTKTAETDDTLELPGGIRLAGTNSGVFTDAGGGVFRTDVGGSPLFAESKGAESLQLPFGTRLMSSAEELEETDPDTGKTVYKKPEGSYYDPTLNAWLVKQDASQMFNTGTFADDMAMFYASQGDIKSAASQTASTSDDYLADLLVSMGLTDSTKLKNSGLSNKDIEDIVSGRAPAKKDDPTVIATKGTSPATASTSPTASQTSTSPNTTNVGGPGNMVITTSRPINPPAEPVEPPVNPVVFQTPVSPTAPNIGPQGTMTITTNRLPKEPEPPIDPVSLITDPLTLTKLPPTVVPPTVAPPAPPTINIDPVKALETFYNPFTPTPRAAPVQSDTGPIQLMTDIFGTNIATTQKAGARGYGFSAGGEIDELLRLLRS